MSPAQVLCNTVSSSCYKDTHHGTRFTSRHHATRSLGLERLYYHDFMCFHTPIPSYTILYRFWTLSFSRYLFCWLPGSATRTPTPRGAAYKLFICIGGSISVTGKTAIGIEQQRVPFPCARPKNLYSSRAE